MSVAVQARSAEAVADREAQEPRSAGVVAFVLGFPERHGLLEGPRGLLGPARRGEDVAVGVLVARGAVGARAAAGGSVVGRRGGGAKEREGQEAGEHGQSA